jgi:CheY-like chemotaxis protein
MPDKRRILVVDDDEHVLFVVAHALARLGEDYEICVSPAGREALTKAEAAQFDLVVTDVFLPDLDGIELTRAMRDKDAELPVIWVTGHASQRVRQQALELGVYVVIEKPIEISELRSNAESAMQAGGRA